LGTAGHYRAETAPATLRFAARVIDATEERCDGIDRASRPARPNWLPGKAARAEITQATIAMYDLPFATKPSGELE
jgi:hypothetical protein